MDSGSISLGASRSMHTLLSRLLAFCGALCIAGVTQTFSQDTEAVAATGRIAGLVVDLDTAMPLIGAKVVVEGTGISATTDLDGRYSLEDIPTGSVNVTFDRDGYQVIQVDNVIVEAGVTSPLELGLPRAVSEADKLLEEGVVELEAFVVEYEAVVSNSLALLADRQKSASVSDAIGSDLFSSLGLGDAAEAMTKVTGASVQDGKYVVIRGLGDRYSNTLLNGASIPSSDPDRRAVQIDQFPSDLLESIVTSKSFTPDQPGAFSGGSVNIKTKDFPDGWFYKVSGSLSYNTKTTGKDILVVPGGGTDWLGMDDGSRELPSSLPEEIPSPRRAQILARSGDFSLAEELNSATRAFSNDTYFPSEDNALPNGGFSVAFGDRFDFESEKQLGYIFSLTYDASSSFYDDGITNRFQALDFEGTEVQYNRIFSTNLSDYSSGFGESFANLENTDLGIQPLGTTSSTQSVNWGLFGKLAFKPSESHKITLDLFHNQSGDDNVRRGIGEDPNDAVSLLNAVYDIIYTERSLSSVQLATESVWGEDDEWKMEWQLSLARSTQQQPDYRAFGYRYNMADGVFEDRSGSDSSRIFRDLTDRNSELSVDMTYNFKQFRDLDLSLKFGGLYGYGDRNRIEDSFNFRISPNSEESLFNYPNPVGITERTEDSVEFGNVIERASTLNNYTGKQVIKAAYAMVDFKFFEDFRVITGARFETTDIKTTPTNTLAEAGLLEEESFLPAFSLVYSINERQNLRFAYGKTMARPTYKELTDIRISDNFTDQVYRGNPNLELTEIDNFDLRWEWFPNDGEIIAVSLFYKELANPIEQILDSTGAITPQNVEEGKVQGVEIEFRKGLGFISDALSNWSFGTNFAYIDSEVSIPDDELASLRSVIPDFESIRELVGQSQYTFNLDTTYNNPEWGLVATLAFNIVGESLDLVTSGPLPDVFEQPAPNLDLIISKQLGDRWSLKLKAENLLDPDFEKTVSLQNEEIIYSSYSRGMSFSIGASYSFN